MRFEADWHPLSMRPAAIALTSMTLTVAGIGVAAAPAQAAPQTFTVTSPSLCGGAGTFEQAVKDANANPGQDTIEFTAGLTVSASPCATLYNGPEQFPIAATESVDILGNGAKVVGDQMWLDQSGQLNNISLCPRAIGSNAQWVTLSKGFMAVGIFGQDNSGVNVAVQSLNFDNLPELVAAYEKSAFSLNSSTATNINSFNENCDRPAIQGFPGADVTLTDVQIDHSYAPGMGTGDADVEGLISGADGDLVLERVFLGENGQGRAVAWGNYQGTSTVQIVSSKFVETRGLRLSASTTDIVNSALYSAGRTSADRVIATQGANRIKASTFYWSTPECNPACSVPGMGFGIAGAATVDFQSSALGAWAGFTNSGPLLFGDTTKFTSDNVTWVQETANQTNADVQANLPNVLTTVPGLTDQGSPDKWWIDVVTPMLGTAVQPGVLIDAVPDAVCPGGANALLNPVDGTCITTDVLGNPRVDAGNGTRNIGAVQNVQSPHLTVAGVTDTTVSLAWNRPVDPASGPVTGYNVYYAPAAGGLQQTFHVPGADVLAVTIPGLTQGTQYAFTVAGVNQVGPGPRSNVVTATPLGPLGLPVVTATGGDGLMVLSWTEPNLAGHAGPPSYFVSYRKKGEAVWIAGPGWLSARTTTIPGLTNGTEYEFAVVATTPDQAMTPTMATALGTPRAAMFVPINPVRAYDSRIGNAPISAGQSRLVSLAGQVPEGAVAVAYNITVIDMNAAGWLTVVPGDVANPPVSSTINWSGRGEVLANGIVVGVDGQRAVKVFAGPDGSAMSTQFVIDVVGYYLPAQLAPSGSTFTPVDPVRAYDSRTALGPLVGGRYRNVNLATNTGGVLPDGVTAVAYNLTVTDSQGAGFLTVTPGDITTYPTSSTINWWGPGQMLANGIDVKVDAGKSVNVFAGPNANARTQFVIDIVGYFAPTSVAPAGSGFTPVTPTRAYDSRTGPGPIAAGQQRTISMATGGLVPEGATAVAYNATVADTTGSGWLTVTPGSVGVLPVSSTINWWATNQFLSNGIAVGVDGQREVNVFAGPNGSGASTDFVLDTVGYYN